jgi:hypothetical protein
MKLENIPLSSERSPERRGEKISEEAKKRAISRFLSGYREFGKPDFSPRVFFPELPEDIY